MPNPFGKVRTQKPPTGGDGNVAKPSVSGGDFFKSAEGKSLCVVAARF